MPLVETRRVETIALASILLAGAFLRVDGVARMSLWVDEAVVANIVIRSDLDRFFAYPASNRPLGYLLLHRGIAALYPSELALRFLSVAPSLLSLPLFVFVARRVLRSRVLQVLAVAVLVFSPYLVTYAKEFKPYALEHALLLGMIACMCAWAARPRSWIVGVFVTIALATVVLTYGPAFVVPAYAVVLALACFAAGQRRDAAMLGATAAAAAAYLLLVSIPIASATPTHLFANHWVDSFASGDVADIAAWCWTRSSDTIAVFGSWRSPRAPSPWLTAAMGGGTLVGVLALTLERRFVALAALALPILAPIAGGILGRWPLGPDRVNLFLVAPIVFLAVAGWDAIVTRTDRRMAWAVAALVIALQMPADVEAYRRKLPRYGSGQEEISAALDIIERRARSGRVGAHAPVVTNKLSRAALEYYTRHEPQDGARRRKLLARRVERVPSRAPSVLRLRLRETLRSGKPVWILFSHALSHEDNVLRALLEEPGMEVFVRRRFPGTTLVLARNRLGASGQASTRTSTTSRRPSRSTPSRASRSKTSGSARTTTGPPPSPARSLHDVGAAQGTARGTDATAATKR